VTLGKQVALDVHKIRASVIISHLIPVMFLLGIQPKVTLHHPKIHIS